MKWGEHALPSCLYKRTVGETPTSLEWHGPGCAEIAPPETCCARGRKALSLLSRVPLQNHRHSSRTRGISSRVRLRKNPVENQIENRG